MAEEKSTLREINFREVFPWFAIFRAFSIAVDPKKLVLAAVGVLMMTGGWSVLAALFTRVSSDPVLQQRTAEASRWPWDENEWTPVSVSAVPKESRVVRILREHQTSLPPAARAEIDEIIRDKKGLAVVEQILRSPLDSLRQLATDWRAVLRPVEQLVGPFRRIFGRDTKFVSLVFTFAAGVWAVAVWALFGGAITRIAAVQFAREEKIGLGESLKFAASKFLSFFGAPVIPLLFLAFFAVFCVAGGLLTRIPVFGPVFAGVLWFLPLVAGFVMAIIVIAWAAGWPLMYSTISVEGSDSFDALSRSWAYAFQRPWHYLFYALVAVVFGSLCLSFVRVFADLLVHLSFWAVAWGGGKNLGNQLNQLTVWAPEASGWRPATGVAVEAPTGPAWFGANCMAIWLYFVFILMVGFVYSYFWSASTIIYYLLRRTVDNTELNEVYLEGAEEEFGAMGGEQLHAAVGTTGGPSASAGPSASPTP